MKTLFKNGTVINVFSGELEKCDVLCDGELIVGVGNYQTETADTVIDASGKFISPGFIDGHIHIESSFMTPPMFAKACLLHGTTSVVCDPHEIANVCGKDGINYMLESSENIPFDVFITLPSCVPATSFDENGATLNACDLEEFYSNERVVALAEMMNYVGVCNNDQTVMEKIRQAKNHNKIINGHAPLLTGEMLNKYICAGIADDHECSNFNEALEKLNKGQVIFIREGTSAKNLEALLPLFDDKYFGRCILVSDDITAIDIIKKGTINNAIKKAVSLGKKAINAITMATINVARHYNLRQLGAIAPGYKADLLLLEDIDTVKIDKVYKNGKLVACDGKVTDFPQPNINEKLKSAVMQSFNLGNLNKDNFIFNENTVKNTRVIKLIKHQLLTEEEICPLDFSISNGIDLSRDIIKIAVIERHNGTGHYFTGFIKGVGLKQGAIASSVSHDSHNLIVIGTNEEDMALACNSVTAMGGGMIVCNQGKILAELALPVGGIMSNMSASEIAQKNSKLLESAFSLGVADDTSPFMTMAFCSLSVIPFIKITTRGLVDVNNQKFLDLFLD